MNIACYLACHDCGTSFTAKRRGRPPEKTRARLDAIFRAVALKGPGGCRGTWKQLPEAHAKPDTVSRTFRHWAKQGLCERLLKEIANPDCLPELRRLAHWIRCAYRRSNRLLGIRGMVLSKRHGRYSALPGPGFCIPDPNLSEEVQRETLRLMAASVEAAGSPGWRPLEWIALLRGLHRIALGVPLNKWLEPA
jgi:hypothetical protein